METTNKHKSGFVNIIGKPNAGKSTLLNQLVGHKMAIVTPKPQTTRHRILAMLNKDDSQIIFSDTPGIITDPAYMLQEKMMKKVNEAIKDADVFLYMTDVNDKVEDSPVIEKLQKSKVPVIVLVNKIDQSNQEKVEEKVEEWAKKLPNAEILPISALHASNLNLLTSKIESLIPEAPPYFPKDEWTDKPERFFVNEIIRENMLKLYDKEIPFSSEVVTESFKRDEVRINIESTIYVERDSQKGIVIGHKGETLSKLGAASRKELEEFFGEKIYLGLYVKVKKDWRKNEKDLHSFGYD